MAEAPHIKPLTSLRFFAAIWVVLFHYWPHLAVAGMPPLIAKGYLGVELFFVLSGFILCHVYLPQFEEGRFRYGDFLWARLARDLSDAPRDADRHGADGGRGAGGRALGRPQRAVAGRAAGQPDAHAGLGPRAGRRLEPSLLVDLGRVVRLSQPSPPFAALTVSLRRWPGVAVAGALAFLAVLYPALRGDSPGFPLTQATTAWGALRIVPCFALGCALYLAWRSECGR